MAGCRHCKAFILRLWGLTSNHDNVERPTPILCCGGGTPHKPPILRPDGYVLHEGTECAQFLIAQVSAASVYELVA